VGEAVSATPPAIAVFQRFKAVLVRQLGGDAAPGTERSVARLRGEAGTVGLKLQVRLDLKGGGLEGPVQLAKDVPRVKGGANATIGNIGRCCIALEGLTW
jgi:hypothetical protein